MEIGPEVTTQLVKQKYELHKAPEVEAAAKRKQAKIGIHVPQDPLARIQNYLERFHEITDREDPESREHGVDAIKRLLHRKYVIRPDEIPESYWETQRRILRERGQGGDLAPADWNELKRQNTEAIIADQTASLDKWIDYLSSPDAPYPDSLKYWTLRSVLSLAEYDKDRGIYPQRSRGTTKPFPNLNREALAYVLDAIDKKYRSQDVDVAKLDQEAAIQFGKLLQGENFARLYTWAIEKTNPVEAKGLTNTKGGWAKFPQGSDPMTYIPTIETDGRQYKGKPLVPSLQGQGTGWCTAGESTALAQLAGGDFYVYYSNDTQGNPTIPRVAIRMEGESIGEVRGIASEQNMDPYIAPVVEQKLGEFPDGKAYQKKVSDMKRLTEIDHKMQAHIPLDTLELTFLYELNSSIQGFGYRRDPRIEELRSQRNPDEDMPIVFACEPSQIAHSPLEIGVGIKAYVGPLVPGIFDLLSEAGIEHIYTSFPEGKIRRQRIEIGGKTQDQLQAELVQAGVIFTRIVEDMMKSPDFTTLPDTKIVDTIQVRIQDLGLSGNPTTDQIYQRAQELGWELCPAELGPHYRLQSEDLPVWFSIGMKQIADALGDPYIFSLGNRNGRVWLNSRWARPDEEWSNGDKFVFILPKSQAQKP